MTDQPQQPQPQPQQLNPDMREILAALLAGNPDGATAVLASIDDPARGVALCLELAVFGAACMNAMFGPRAAEMLGNATITPRTSTPPAAPPTGMYL